MSVSTLSSFALAIVATHHIALTTRNFDCLRDFYTQRLGLAVVGGFPGEDIVFIEAGTTTIELIGEESPEGTIGPGWDHLAWEVEDLDEAFRELTARGVVFHVPPEGYPPAAPSMRIAFFRDPDGNLLELVQPLGERYPNKTALPAAGNAERLGEGWGEGGCVTGERLPAERYLTARIS